MTQLEDLLVHEQLTGVLRNGGADGDRDAVLLDDLEVMALGAGIGTAGNQRPDQQGHSKQR